MLYKSILREAGTFINLHEACPNPVGQSCQPYSTLTQPNIRAWFEFALKLVSDLQAAAKAAEMAAHTETEEATSMHNGLAQWTARSPLALASQASTLPAMHHASPIKPCPLLANSPYPTRSMHGAAPRSCQQELILSGQGLKLSSLPAEPAEVQYTKYST